MAVASSNYNRSSHKPRVILVTGPPLNGRDDYLKKVIEILEKSGETVGNNYVFEEMQKVAPSFGISNLSRANVLTIPSQTLDQIRSQAFSNISERIKTSKNNFEFVSSPGTFRIRPSVTSTASGRMNGLELVHLKSLDPSLVIILIADLIEVRTALSADPVWRTRVESNLKTLAEWRGESIDLIEKDASDWALSQNRRPLDYIIFGKAHSPKTLAELCIGKKPRIYTSFAITGTPESLPKVDEVRKKLEDDFVCINPYSIRDWEIIAEFDKSIEEGNPNTFLPTANQNLPTKEIEVAIDNIRAQTVTRDYSLVRNSHATVVLHLAKQPSYGVMCEIIETRKSFNPVYVLYPFKTRPSPFLEDYASRENIIQNENLDVCVKALITKMKQDIESALWPRWKSSR